MATEIEEKLKDYQLQLLELWEKPRERSSARELLAKIITEYDHFITIESSKVLYHFCNGIWVPNGEIIVEQHCETVLERYCDNRTVNEIIAKVKRLTYRDPDIFQVDPDIICVQNGVLDIISNELVQHSPDYFFINKLPVLYDKDAQCPRILKFLMEILPKTPKERETLFQFIGYCLLRDYPIQQFIILNGDGANGKGVFLKLLIKFFSKENISGLEIHDFNDQRKRVSLVGKLLNLSGEMNKKVIKDLSNLKDITGGDLVTIDPKFKDPFEILLYAKLIFANNILPEFKDSDDAFFRRIIVIDFLQKFLAEDKKTDLDLIEKLATPEELSGLLNEALHYLSVLLKEKKYKCYLGLEANRLKLAPKLNPIVYMFDEGYTEYVQGNKEMGSDVYDLFSWMCTKDNLRVMGKQRFYSDLVGLSDGKIIKIDDRHRVAFTGISIIKINGLAEGNKLDEFLE